MKNCPHCGGALPKAKAVPAPKNLGPSSDPRLPTNTKRCSAVGFVFEGERSTLTAAKARAIRRKAMQACGCRLCALALNPPLSFAEHARFRAGIPREEMAALFTEPTGKWLKTRCAECGRPECYAYSPNCPGSAKEASHG